jgi:hypothetical protein
MSPQFLDEQINTRISETHILGHYFQIPFGAANEALLQSFNNLSGLYRISDPTHSFRRDRQKLFTAALLYSENIHTKVLALVEAFKYISRTCLESVVFVSPSLLKKVAQDCVAAEHLGDGLHLVFLRILNELNDFEKELAQTRENHSQEGKIKPAAGGLEKTRDTAGKHSLT